jgi:leader peptidase (prepilin peptidase) / N-methyltransferase
MQTILATWSHLLQTSPALWIGVVFVFGLLVGSFLNVVIHRVPIMMERAWREEAAEILAAPAADGSVNRPDGQQGTPSKPAAFNLVTPRSACPKCGAQITAWQNIPVVSYLMLGGKCANCRTPISVRYPLVELATAVLSAVVAWQFGFGWQAVAALVLTWMLIGLAMIDFDRQWLPDTMTLPLMWLGLLLALFGSRSGPSVPVDLRSAVIGAAAGYLSLWSVNQAYQLIARRPGMGYGDFKLLAALGAWMGWQMLLPIILLSAVAGSVVGVGLIMVQGRDRRIPIPYGPFLAVAGWVAMLWGDSLVTWYLRISKLGAVTAA